MPFEAGPRFWKYPITGHGPNDAKDQERTCDTGVSIVKYAFGAALRLSRGWDHCHAATADATLAIIRSAKYCTSPLDPLRAVTSMQLSSSK